MGNVADLFTKLADKYPLFILVLGSMIAVLAAAEEVPIGSQGIKFGSTSRLILGGLSGVFIIFSLWKLERGKDDRNSSSNSPSQNLSSSGQLYKDFQEYDEQIENLNSTLDAIKAFISDKDDDTATRIRLIISQADDAIRKIVDRPKEVNLLIKWIDYRINKWVNLIKASDYDEISRNKILEFREEIRQHLNLLKNNILEGTFAAPHLCGIRRHNEYPFPYKKALETIQTQIQQELDKTNELSPNERYILMQYMSQLIEDVV